MMTQQQSWLKRSRRTHTHVQTFTIRRAALFSLERKAPKNALVNFNKIICPYTLCRARVRRNRRYARVCVRARVRGRTAKFVEPIEPDGGPNDGQSGGPICFYRSFVSLFGFAPSGPLPSALGVSFTAEPLRAKLVNSSVTIRQANPPPPIAHRRNGQLLTASERAASVCARVLHRRIRRWRDRRRFGHSR